MLLRISKIAVGITVRKERNKKNGGEKKKVKTKTIGTLLIAGLVVLSAMVVFATPVMAVDIWDGEDECDDDDPVRFNGTITMADGPWANKHVGIAKWRGGLHGLDWYSPKLGQWKVQTDGDGYYQTRYAPWLRPGHFGLFVSETGDEGTWELLEEQELVRYDYKDDGCLYWTYIWDYTIPEFATIALPAVSVLGLFLFFNHRKRRKE